MEFGKKTENNGKWEIHTLGHEIWRGKLKKVENLEMSTVGHGMARKLKIMENEKHPLDLKNDEITEKREKWKMHTVWPGIWRKNWKSRKMRITLVR